MSSISDLSDHPQYSIKHVTEQTGILSVTLRAWERRYGVLQPSRARNHYRLYSDRDVALLRWVKSRVDRGDSISKTVTELKSMLNQGRWPEELPPAQVNPPIQNVHSSEYYSQRLYQALIQHNEIHAGRWINEMLSMFDLSIVCTKILTPCLAEIGEAWYRGDIHVATEHFASSFIRGRLLTLLQNTPLKRGPTDVLTGCASTEIHEIGSLMLTLLLRRQEVRVEYLGPDLPVEDLVDYAKMTHPRIIALSSSIGQSAQQMKRLQEKLNSADPQIFFGYGGRAFNLDPLLRKNIPGIFLGETLDAGVAAIRNLLDTAKSAEGL